MSNQNSITHDELEKKIKEFDGQSLIDKKRN